MISKILIDDIKEELNLVYDYELSKEELEFFTINVERPWKVKINIKKCLDLTLNICIKIEQIINFACFKCLDLVKLSLLYDVNLSKEENQVYIQNGLLDLEKLIHDEVLLSIPNEIQCKEDCKGLCSVCYTNLNHNKCDCEDNSFQESENPFKQLYKLTENN